MEPADARRGAKGRAHGVGDLPRAVLLLALAAVCLRLVMFLGRGDYVAFDEGWYLLLGRNLWAGNGFTLTGLQHVALSPLFPVLAGGVGRLVGDPVWGGRLVAAVSSGLLVLPCWMVFRRLAGPGVATAGAVLVAVMPSLAPFVVPYWIGWDLWVGAEPLFHLLLFTGIALFLAAWDGAGWAARLGCGAAFALAYLARPEGIAAFGLLGLGAVGLGALGARRARTRVPAGAELVAGVGACALSFVLLSAPYWVYLHDTLGRWTITGRAVELAPEAVVSRPASSRAGTNRIETMLWQGDSSPYVERLYALDRSGSTLANSYWGVPGEADGTVSTTPPAEPSGPGAQASPAASARSPDTTVSSLPSAAEGPSAEDPPPGDPWVLRYARALGVVVPWYAWLFVLPGLLAPARDRRLDLEALVAVPLVLTSVLIARMVAIDPRTQLLLAPLVAFYAARGALASGDALARRLDAGIPPGRLSRTLVGILALVLLGTSLFRLTMSLTVGSPHHLVAAENAAVGEAIGSVAPESATVVSFHPALALFADRDWRVLPVEPMERIVRYARTQPSPYLVLSVFYPPELRPLEEPHYLIVPLGADLPGGDRWRIHVPRPGSVFAFGELVPLE